MNADGSSSPRRMWTRAGLPALAPAAIILALGFLHAWVLARVIVARTTRALEEREAQTTAALLATRLERSFGPRVRELVQDETSRPAAVEELKRIVEECGGFRFKLWDSQATVIWSDEAGLVGRRFPDNELVWDALAGRPRTVLEETDRAEHVYERAHARFVAEVYVPLRGERGEIVGVAEVYRNGEGLVAAIDRIRWAVWAGAGVATLSLCLAATVIVAGVRRRFSRLERALVEQNRALAEETERLGRIVGGIGAGIWAVDESRTILWANDVAQRWFGNGTPLVGRRCHEVCRKGNNPCEPCAVQECLSQEREAHAYRAIRLPDGRFQHMHVSAWPLAQRDGKPRQALEVFVDLTDWVELEMELLHAGRLAAVGEVASGLAHDVSNPVGAILACVTHRLRSQPGTGDAGVREDLELVRRNAERVADTLRDLVRRARRSDRERTRVDLNALIEESMKLARHRVTEHGVRIDLRPAPHMPSVLASPQDLETALLNLVINGCDAMPNGGTLRVETGCADGQGPAAILRVSDTGHGIAPEHRGRIFEPFFTTKPQGEGTGLGLAIARRIVVAHGGEIRLVETSAAGTTFEIRLPALPEEKPR